MSDKKDAHLAIEVNRAIHTKDPNRLMQAVRHLMEHHGLAACPDFLAGLPTEAEKVDRAIEVGRKVKY